MALANITNNILTDTGVNVSSLTPTSTTISTTAPLQGGGDLSANRTLSITQSSASVNGYLSSGDWTIFNSKQAAGTYITSLTGEATGTGPGATAVTLNNASVTAKILTGVNITGGTVQATDTMLTAFGKLQNQINGLIGSSIYQGTWNASTNTPTLTSSVGTRGYYYIVSVAGTTNLNGITDWFVGDWVIFDGTAWQQVDNTDAVVSVNGQTGAVSLTTDNIAEGATNQYFLNSRARAALSFAAGSGAYNSTTGVITIPTNNNQITNGSNYITLTSLSGTAPIVYSNTTGAISITQSGTASNGYLSSTDWNTFNNKQATLSLTTTGTSGAATLIANVLNVPNYGGALTGYVPYTGATANVDLGAYSLTAGAATLTSNLWLKNTGSYDFIISNNTSLTTNVVRAYYTTTDELRFYAKNTAGASVVPKIMVGDGTTFTQLGTGTVTSVAALTIGTSGTDVSSTVANSTTTPVITLNVPTASATNRGVLASADWTTFNNKQSALTNPVTGTGTTNYLPKFTGASTIGNSLVYDNGTNIAIGGTTITDGNMLNVIGNQSSVNVGLVLNNTNSTYARIYSIQNVNSNFVLYDYTASAARLTMTSTGNLGLGVTPTTLDAGGVNLQIKDRSAFFQLAAVNSTYLSNNIYYDGAWKRFASGYGTMIRLTDDNNGISFYTTGTGAANSAASLTQAMTLTAAGRLLINKTNEETYQLDVNGTGRFSGTTSFTNGTAGIILGSPSISGVNLNFSYYSASAASRTWNIRNDQSVYGDFAIQQSTTQSGSTFSNILYFSSTGAATFSSSVQAQKLSIAAGTFAAFSLEVDQQSTFAFGSTNGKRIAIIRDSTAADSGLQFGYDATDKTGIIAGSATSAGAGIDFYTFNGTAWGNRMRITSTGNVGIGTSSPNHLLSLSATASNATVIGLYNTFNDATNRNWAIATNQTAFGDFDIRQSTAQNGNPITSGTSRLYINASGNVGIGTTTPSQKLSVQGDANNWAGNFIGSTTTGQSLGLLVTAGTNSSDYAMLVRNNTTLSALFTILGTGAATFSSSVQAGNNFVAKGTLQGYSGGGMFMSYESYGGRLESYDYSTSAWKNIAIAPNGGNVGIGTSSPEQLLSVAGGNVIISGNTGANRQVIEFTTSSTVATIGASYVGSSSFGDLAFKTSGTTRLTIASGGGATFTSSVTATSFFESSDSRLKTLIQDNYQTKGIASITPKLYTKNGKVELGYYAQDFVGVLDSAVSKGSDDMLSLSYREVHTAKIYALEQEIKELKAKMN